MQNKDRSGIRTATVLQKFLEKHSSGAVYVQQYDVSCQHYTLHRGINR